MNPENNSSPQSVYEKLVQWFVSAGVLLLPLLFLPWQGMAVYQTKFALFATLAVLAAIAFLSNLLVKGTFVLPRQKMMLALIAVSIVSIISALVNGTFVKSFSGTAFEINTSAIWAIGVVFVLIMALSRGSERGLSKAVKLFIWSVFVVIAAMALKILSAYGILPQSLVRLYPDFLPGGIVDTAIILGAGMVVALNFLVFGRTSRKWQKTLYAVIVIGSLLFAGAINFKPFIYLVAIFSLAHLVYAISMGKRVVQGELAEMQSQEKTSSPFSLLVLVVSLILILGGSTFSGYLSRVLKISNIDVRPNISSTMNLVIDGWKENALLGVGPNKFSNLWNQNRPEGVNLTNFWSTDFANGFGYVPTLAAETGVLGTAAFLLFLVLFAKAGFRAIFSHLEDPNKKLILTSSFFTALYLWLMSFIYTPSIAAVVLSFLFTGIFISALTVFGISRQREVNLFGNPKLNFVSVFAIVVLIISVIAGGYFTWERVVASTVFARGEQALGSGETQKAAELFARAALIANSETYWRATANTFLLLLQSKMNAIGSAQSIDEATRAEIQNYIGNAVLSADNAVKVDRENYLNYFVLGNIYESLASRGMPEAAGLARQNYDQAKKYSPKNPGIPLVMARLSMAEGKAEEALSELEQSLTLKPNFTDAFFMKAQIEVLRNNIPGAIKSVEDATLVDPFNAGLYFQLGLLKYNVKDWRGAAAAFERALAVVPNYANAKYFLGLAYDTLGRTEEAVAQFEDLEKSNPNNQEVKFILANLKAGKDPFANAKPPIDEKPEKRSEPPLEE